MSVVPTMEFLYGLAQGSEHAVDIEEGKRLLLGVQAVSEPDERGFRTVMSTLNGQLRPVAVRDRAVASDVPAQEKADTSKPGHVAAPFDGAVTIAVEDGATVAAGDTVATIEAMKMEASITAPVAGFSTAIPFGTCATGSGRRRVRRGEGGDGVVDEVAMGFLPEFGRCDGEPPASGVACGAGHVDFLKGKGGALVRDPDRGIG